MFRIFVLFALILFSGAFTATAGIITCDQDPPELELDVSAMETPADVPEQPAHLDQDSDLGLTVSITPTQSFPLTAIATRERSMALTLDSERIRVWNASLPRCPFLGFQLKPA